MELDSAADMQPNKNTTLCGVCGRWVKHLWNHSHTQIHRKNIAAIEARNNKLFSGKLSAPLIVAAPRDE